MPDFTRRISGKKNPPAHTLQLGDNLLGHLYAVLLGQGENLNLEPFRRLGQLAHVDDQ
jgi:hypothetical protein